MSDTNVTPVLTVQEQDSTPDSPDRSRHWLPALKSPLWLCLLVAILARVWLIVHTNGVMAGDEAMVGLQAEHIVRGEWPVYYYGQPYMGSLEAYMAALAFKITGGPSVWAMRLQTIPLGMLMTYLAWRLAGALADEARLAGRLKRYFQTLAALVAGFPPLYDMAEEVRVQGGYMNAFVIMLWLLLCTYRLTQRWRVATRRELALRWAGIGLLLGLGFWIDPLIIYACVAMLIWLVAFCVGEWRRRRGQTGTQSRLALVQGFLLCVCAVPTILVGFFPGLIWGAQNHWANVLYIFQEAANSTAPLVRLENIAKVSVLYSYCLAPRAMGGSLPTQPGVTTANPQIVTFGLLVVTAALLLSLGSFLFRKQAAVFATVRTLTALPLLFFGCTTLVFCVASVSTAALASGCGPADYGGRYVVPLVNALPFLVATFALLPALMIQQRRLEAGEEGVVASRGSLRERFQRTFAGTPRLQWAQLGLLVLMLCYFGIQIGMYEQADPNYTFQATGCLSRNPAHVEAIVQYLEAQDIHYVWATGWIGDHINFATDGAVIATKIGGRIPSDVEALLHAPHASILAMVAASDTHPSFLDALDATGVQYKTARFYASPGYEAMIVTPLNRTLEPSDPTYSAIFGRSFSGCV
jgi:hypothetical protein